MVLPRPTSQLESLLHLEPPIPTTLRSLYCLNSTPGPSSTTLRPLHPRSPFTPRPPPNHRPPLPTHLHPLPPLDPTIAPYNPSRHHPSSIPCTVLVTIAWTGPPSLIEFHSIDNNSITNNLTDCIHTDFHIIVDFTSFGRPLPTCLRVMIRGDPRLKTTP